jgi:hypothetical protein
VLPIFVEVGLCAIGEKVPPGFLEINSRLVEGGGRAGRAFPWIAARIEAAAPAARVGVGRIARAHGDRADAHVTAVDLPGLFRGIKTHSRASGHGRSGTRIAKMIEGNVVMTWLATVAIIAIRAWRLVFFSDGPEPHVQIDQGDIFPFRVDRRGL